MKQTNHVGTYSSSLPRRLLTFLVVGGGPTCIEFTSELCDFIQDDVTKWYRDLESDYRVIVVEAGRSVRKRKIGKV